MSNIRFSIIMPTYNRAALFRRSIDSVLGQSFTEFELIIVDDGSTDNTEEVVNSISDARIKYVKIDNGERGRARNIGQSKAIGQYVYFFDSDDLLYPFHLEEADRLLQKDAPILWLPYEICDSKASVTRPYKKSNKPVLYRLIKDGNFLSCHGVFIAKEIADRHLFSEIRELSGSEDMELWIRLAARYPFKIGDRVTSCLIEHTQRSVNNFGELEGLIQRKNLMLKSLKMDKEAWSIICDKEHLIKSASHSYIALHGVMNSNVSLKMSWQQFAKALYHSPPSLFTKRSLAIVKHSIKRIF